ncbi:MAG: carboxypeptidase-like regulatory domain-containing protein [Pedobacter sp.]|nr:MAG: carboxypeptidase-like regulatory domain-containing protein [Pedobacter sp.]
MKIQTFILLLSLFAINVSAQVATVRGIIKDKQGSPIPMAGIYLAGYKAATMTDNNGNFKFPPLQPGNYDIIVQMVGFLPGKANVSLENKDVTVNITLQESTTNIKQVVIMPDPNRARYIELFKEYFIGKTENAAKCKLLNPEILRIDFDREENVLNVSTDEFLVLDNPVLGYKVKYLLQKFEYDIKKRIVYFEGQNVFEEMNGSERMKRKWAKAREIAYRGSIQHFYRSLSNGTANKEGFVINKLKTLPNKNRPADSLIEANIKRLTKGQANIQRVLTFTSGDSISYWLKMRREPVTMAIVDRGNVLIDTLVHTYDQNIKYLNFTDDLYVIYTKEKQPENFSFTGYWLSRPRDITDEQVSQIKAYKLPLAFYANGAQTDPSWSLQKGYWAYEKVADQVPLDYEPIP